MTDIPALTVRKSWKLARFTAIVIASVACWLLTRKLARSA
jgi:hypothetical protein